MAQHCKREVRPRAHLSVWQVDVRTLVPLWRLRQLCLQLLGPRIAVHEVYGRLLAGAVRDGWAPCEKRTKSSLLHIIS